MNLEQYRALHNNLRVDIPHVHEKNEVPSATDPTQDIPVRMIQMTASGIPLNVKENPLKFTNVKAENLTSIDKRHCDTFDAVGELQDAAKKFNKKGISITKTLKEDEK